ncbi:MAG: ATP-dependent DNA ligase [Candidatus Woesearchaeota archaeon]
MSLLFKDLAETFEELEKTSSGNTLRAILAELFKKVSKAEIDKVAYLTLGRIASDYSDINLGMAEKMVLRAVALASNKDEKAVLALYKKLGDIGLVAEQLVGRKRKDLTITEVFDTFHKIAAASGAGSQEQKISLLAGLLKNASAREARYLARIVQGNLRLGVGDKTVLDALCITFTGSKAAKKEVEHAYTISPDVGVIARTIATKGLAGIRKIGVTLGVPIQMMLCQRVKNLDEIPEKMGKPFAVEEKYDGERIQAHKKGDKITLYSRRLENITSQFPDIVEAVRKNVKARDCVIEGECMPVDKKGNLLPFQVLMQRRRKHGIEEYVKRIPVCLFVFEMLYYNGKSLIREPYPKRYEVLLKNIKESDRIKLALRVICDNPDCAEELFNTTVQRGGEGIVIKSLQPDSTYEAGVRGWHWVKWKPEYVKGLRDTFDLVVVGAYKGRGRRAGTYGALLCAVYNDSADRFETFCKLGSGFTDKDLEELPKKFKKHEIPHKPALLEVSKLMIPDVWFEPAVVIEVTGAEITRSPNHTCGLKKGQGLALRFPRFLRYRPEKSAEQATTTKEILRMAKK